MVQMRMAGTTKAKYRPAFVVLVILVALIIYSVVLDGCISSSARILTCLLLGILKHDSARKYLLFRRLIRAAEFLHHSQRHSTKENSSGRGDDNGDDEKTSAS